jgi:hypothetical protein
VSKEASAYRLRSRVYQRLGREDQAQADLKKASGLDSGSGN